MIYNRYHIIIYVSLSPSFSLFRSWSVFLEIIVTFLFLALGYGTKIDTAISECLLHSEAYLYIRMSMVFPGLLLYQNDCSSPRPTSISECL